MKLKKSISFLINSDWNSKWEIWLLAIITITGFTSSCFTFHFLNGYQYNFGKNLIGAFPPPVLSLLFLTIKASKTKLNNVDLIKVLISYLIQIIPFITLFHQVFVPTPEDDFSRYYLYAKNMVDNHTLWGGDRLFFSNGGNYYITQPGYRYFIFLELKTFGDLYRAVSFVNIGFYIIATFYFQKVIQYVCINNKKLQTALLLLIFLFTPYAVKNSLMGLSEWLTVLIIMMVSYFYIITKREYIAVFLLGLVPFFRQNLLISVLLIALLIILNSRKKLLLLTCFIVPLFLPLYHNLYYANEWRFFVDIFNVPFLNYSATANHAIQSINYNFIETNILHYIGLDIIDGKISFSLIGFVFVPYSVYVYFLLLKKLKFLKEKFIYFLITMAAIVPALFLGSAYYPRFDFVNAGIIVFSFLMIFKTDMNQSLS